MSFDVHAGVLEETGTALLDVDFRTACQMLFYRTDGHNLETCCLSFAGFDIAVFPYSPPVQSMLEIVCDAALRRSEECFKCRKLLASKIQQQC